MRWFRPGSCKNPRKMYAEIRAKANRRSIEFNRQIPKICVLCGKEPPCQHWPMRSKARRNNR